MPRFTMTPQAEREAFGAELRRQRTRLDMSQTELARALGLQSQGSISGWEQGTVEPERTHVFQMEELFGLQAGYLSSLLGYGPPTHAGGRPRRAKESKPTIRRALAEDERLTKEGRDALLSMYRVLVNPVIPDQPISAKSWEGILAGLDRVERAA